MSKGLIGAGRHERSYFPHYLEPAQDLGEGASPVIQEAWIGSISTRRVDDLVQAMGPSTIRRAKSPTCAKTLMNGSTPSRSADQRQVALSLALHYLPQGPRRWPHCLGCGDNCHARLATWLLTEFDPD